MFSLKDKTAVVTGAASGIGRAVALVFARQGAMVHLLDMNEEGLAEAVAFIEKENGKAMSHLTDVTNQATIKLLFESFDILSRSKFPTAIIPIESLLVNSASLIILSNSAS